MSTRRDHLVETALKLFYTNGFNATGIDKVLAESGVAKMTLYKHFRSKDELILAALQSRDERFRNWLMTEMDKAATEPTGQLLAMFDALETWFEGKAFKGLGFCGCAFVNAAGEFSDHSHPAHRVAAEHKTRIVEYLTKLCAEAGVSDPSEVAEKLALLKEGAIVTAHVRGMPEAAKLAKEMARHLLAESRPTD
ncbi:TetR/AcrR family transcriptional regulator [Marivita sp. XM-24bin2]|uniref:TetR/AcrR family transcriptional regulator n=1 Tax=Marivita sp. XM-24bin2 TaxID=2133951 RepID=UPI000D799E1C|nr:TetR/AcrR family transcriptional regulator [Marivita sp. XM-24bin2]MCR9111232.1 TetR/AcrR family transcriptional regulator [Paracoccaceae bacterium]PWL33201.1 MAG: TetR family transcriptional regulator [Marivita sp. XM-24bin2]